MVPLVAPGVLPADSGEFQLVVRDLGIAHPPGYALYTMSAHLFGRLVLALPLGDWPAAAPAGLGADMAYDPWAWSVNLYSALLAALTLALVFQVAAELAGTGAGLLAVLALLASPTFLAQTTVANVRMPAALLTAVVLRTAQRASRGACRVAGQPPDGRRVDRAAVGLALSLGLAIGHHPSLVVFLPLAIGLVAWTRPDLRRSRRTLGACLAGLLVALTPILYLPWRDQAGAPLAPGNLTTWRGLLEHVSGYGFRGDVVTLVEQATLSDRLAVVIQIFGLQFGSLGIGLAIAGLVGLLTGQICMPNRSAGQTSVQPFGLLLVAAALGVAALVVAYRAPQTTEYLMPAYVVLAVATGAGPAALLAGVRRLARGRQGTVFVLPAEPHGRHGGARSAVRRWLSTRVPEGALVGLAGAVFALASVRWGVEIGRAHRTAELPRVLTILHSPAVPPGSTILANWHHVTALWYAARHLAGRSDIRVEYVYPRDGEPLGETLLRLATRGAGPVLISHRSPQLLAADVALWPVAPAPFAALFPVAPATAGEPKSPPDAQRTTAWTASAAPWRIRFRRPPVLGNTLRLTAVDVDATSRDGLELVVWFEPTQEVREPLTIVAQLRDAQNHVWAQMDQPHTAARWNHPGGLAERLQLVPFRRPAAPRQGLRLAIGVYRLAASGAERLPLTDPGDAEALFSTAGQPASDSAVLLTLPDDLLAHTADAATTPLPPQAIPFGSAMTLLGWKMQRRGDDFVVDLQWRAERAFDKDYTVSVQLLGREWSAQHDGTPALGCLPTLKWLPGMTIWDRHRIRLPPAAREAGAERPTVTVAVYDAFSLAPLPITDAERVRQGQGQIVRLEPTSGP